MNWLQNTTPHPENSMMISFDVKSLFTSIPTSDCVDIIKTKLENHQTLHERTQLSPDEICELLQITLDNTFFTFEGQLYEQKSGAAMGSPISPIVASIYMETIEDQVFEELKQDKPYFWKRYVDDIFAVIDKNAVNTVLDKLNSFHPSVQFTVETENQNSIPFLDVLVKKDPTSQNIQTTVYYKSTHTGQYLNYHSHHPVIHKQSVVDTLVSRASNICSTKKDKSKEINHLKEMLQTNSYPSAFIKKRITKTETKSAADNPPQEAATQNTFKTTAVLPYTRNISEELSRCLRKYNVRTVHKTSNTLKQKLTRVKDQASTKEKTGIIYSIPCKDCNEQYIGQTRRTLPERIYQHKNAYKNLDFQKTATINHSIDNNHQIDFESSHILAREKNHKRREIKEAIMIASNETYNKSDGYQLPPVFKTFISSHPEGFKKSRTFSNPDSLKMAAC